MPGDDRRQGSVQSARGRLPGAKIGVSDHDDNTHAQVMLLVLGELISDEHLDGAGLDAFLAKARASADARLAARSGD